jgi:SAM-dependent methyltransferase
MGAAEAGDGFYGADLAYVHDVGFGDFARGAADGIIAALAERGIAEGLVVDLGCGTGILAERLLAVGYEILGADLSEDALAIARRRAPDARFVRASAFDLELPSCAAVTAVGEVLGYAADERSGRDALRGVFSRAREALAEGGLLSFDLAGPGREPEPRTSWREGEGWVCCAAAVEDPGRGEIRRRIVAFRETDGGWRRSDEEHVLRLHRPDDVLEDLAAAGFEATVLERYGDAGQAIPGLAVFQAWI